MYYSGAEVITIYLSLNIFFLSSVSIVDLMTQISTCSFNTIFDWLCSMKSN